MTHVYYKGSCRVEKNPQSLYRFIHLFSIDFLKFDVYQDAIKLPNSWLIQGFQFKNISHKYNIPIKRNLMKKP